MNAATDFGKVAVLYGGDSDERDVSLQSGAGVCRALQSLGIDADLFDPSARPLQDLLALKVACAFNALHGGSGEDGTLQGALAMLGVPVTGSGVLGSALAMDKVRSKIVLAAAGVPVPRSRTVAPGATLPDALELPVFIKPANGGSSIAATPVYERAGLAPAVARVHELHAVALIEPLLTGPEYTVAVLGEATLPSIRIESDNAFYDYDAKYVSEDTRFICPALADDDPLAATLAELALTSFNALACSGWGRVDFMLDAGGAPFVLEVNTVPGMTSHSLVPRAAAAAGIDYPELCRRVLATSRAADDRGGPGDGQ